MNNLVDKVCVQVNGSSIRGTLSDLHLQKDQWAGESLHLLT